MATDTLANPPIIWPATHVTTGEARAARTFATWYFSAPGMSATMTQEDVLELDVELDVEKARALIDRFQQVRRELDAESDA